MCDNHTDYPDFYDESKPRAKKNYHCCACTEPILVGERYVYIAGKWDGDFNTFRQCLRCHEIVRGLYNIIPVGDTVDITLDCDAEPLSPDEYPELDALAFITRM